jgi:hypothetical protein
MSCNGVIGGAEGSRNLGCGQADRAGVQPLVRQRLMGGSTRSPLGPHIYSFVRAGPHGSQIKMAPSVTVAR